MAVCGIAAGVTGGIACALLSHVDARNPTDDVWVVVLRPAAADAASQVTGDALRRFCANGGHDDVAGFFCCATRKRTSPQRLQLPLQDFCTFDACHRSNALSITCSSISRRRSSGSMALLIAK